MLHVKFIITYSNVLYCKCFGCNTCSWIKLGKKLLWLLNIKLTHKNKSNPWSGWIWHWSSDRATAVTLSGTVRRGPDPTFQLLFHDDPASWTSIISIPKYSIFPNTTSHAKILATTASQVAVKSCISSRNFAFFLILHCSSIKSQIPRPCLSP